MEEYLFLGRAAERSLIVLGGFFCFWLSWKFSAGSGDGEANLKWDKITIELKKIGPSIFFSLFGVSVLVTSILSPLEVNVSKQSQASKIKYLSPAEENSHIVKLGDVDKNIQRLMNYSRTLRNTPATKKVREDVSRLIEELHVKKSILLDVAFGTQNAIIYKKINTLCADERTQKDCSKHRRLLNKDLFTQMHNFGK